MSKGLYIVNVLNNGSHIKDSPFVLFVKSDDEDNEDQKQQPDELSSQIKVDGLNFGTKSYVGVPLQFTIESLSTFFVELLF